MFGPAEGNKKRKGWVLVHFYFLVFRTKISCEVDVLRGYFTILVFFKKKTIYLNGWINKQFIRMGDSCCLKKSEALRVGRLSLNSVVNGG